MGQSIIVVGMSLHGAGRDRNIIVTSTFKLYKTGRLLIKFNIHIQ